MKESADLISSNDVSVAQLLRKLDLNVGCNNCAADKFAPISTVSGTNLAQCGQLLTRDQFCGEEKISATGSLRFAASF